MKLNIDCVRDLLLALEESLQFGEELEYPLLYLNDVMNSSYISSKYTVQDVAYTSLKMIEGGYIEGADQKADGRCAEIAYASITFSGHQYLESIRDNKIWSSVKKTLEKASGSVPLSIISSLATKYLSKLLKLDP